MQKVQAYPKMIFGT